MSPTTIFWVPTIVTVCGDLLRSCGSARARTRKCQEDNLGVMLKVAIMEQVHINLDLIAIGIARENMQTKIRFARRSDDPRTLPWML